MTQKSQEALEYIHRQREQAETPDELFLHYDPERRLINDGHILNYDGEKVRHFIYH